MKTTPLDANKYSPLSGGPSFSLQNRLIRLLWGFTWFFLARWTPNFFWRWRIFLLRLFGAKTSNRCDVRGSASVWLPANLSLGYGSLIGDRVICYNQAMITLAEGAIVSQGAHLCAGSHDVDDPNLQLVTKPITINKNAWIASDAFLGPGTTVGESAVIGARGVLFGNAEPWTIYAGNPAKIVRKRKARDS